MNASERAVRDGQALELRRAGVTIPRIVAELGYPTAKAAEEGVARALKAQGTTSDPADVRALELDRLDRLQQAVWVKAVKGDPKAIEQAQKLSEARVRLAGIADRGASVLTQAFDSTIASLALEDADVALVASGRRIAERIDNSAASGDALAETKALYLLPHLMNVLRELGATPAARADMKAQAKNGDTEKRAKLQALRAPKAG